MLHRIEAVEAKPDYRVWIRFADGVEGVLDLSDFVGQGVFEAWTDPEFFGQVFIEDETGTIAWPGGIDLAPDRLYSDIVSAKSA